jgi:UDP:flavonoid glycosyltransferase YjiC (YdhE family)
MDRVKIALFPLGSAGDVHPFIGLGQALKDRGHDVAIMVNGYFRDLVQQVGLEYLELGTAEEFHSVVGDPDLWRPIRSFGSVFRHGIARALRDQYTAVARHFSDGRTLLLANCQARRFFSAAVDACQRLGRRGVLLTPFAEQVPPSLPQTVKHFDYIPFSRILPRSAALVHHGGIGTTAQGLRAGVCQIVEQFERHPG